MTRISKEKQDKIMANIISHLYENSPQALFTSEISKMEIRDEEFIKRLLIDLKEKNLVVEVKKSPEGLDYIRRTRWRLSEKAHTAYKKHFDINSSED